MHDDSIGNLLEAAAPIIRLLATLQSDTVQCCEGLGHGKKTSPSVDRVLLPKGVGMVREDIVNVALNKLDERLVRCVVVPRIVLCAKVLEDRGDDLTLDHRLCPVRKRLIPERLAATIAVIVAGLIAGLSV